MARTIMMVPATTGAGTKTVAYGLFDALVNKNVRVTVLPEFDTDVIEDLLISKQRSSIYEQVLEQCDLVAANNDLIIVNGISLDKPYAKEINYELAVALGAATIFVFGAKQNFSEGLKQLMIVLDSYQEKSTVQILGIIANKIDLQDVATLNRSVNSLGLKIPLLGTVPYKNELMERGNSRYLGATISKYFELNWLWPFLNSIGEKPFTPTMFRHRLFSLAKEASKKIVLPEGEEPRVLEAANICMERGIARCVLLGNKQNILNACQQNNINLHDQIEIIEPQSVATKYVEPLCVARSKKGLTSEAALEQLRDATFLGTMMLHVGDVDGLVSGAVNTTANTIRPALQIIKTAPDAKLVSSVFFMCLPDQVLVYGDCAINPNPNPEELADIAIQSAKSAAAFGINPRVAMLSYSTGKSGAGEDVDKVRAATEIVKIQQPDLAIDGPLQYDAAIDPSVAALKAPNSMVAGRANVFIMPDLNVGNISYKAVQRSTGIVCVGPMLQGLRKPVNDLSRGCTVEDIVFTIAITTVQALK